MMRKIFLVLAFIIFGLPTWANEDLPESNLFDMPSILSMPEIEEIQLFSSENTASNTNPYHTYDGKEQYRQMLKGGVQFEDETTKISKDGMAITYKPKKTKGEFHIGHLYGGTSTNGSIGGFTAFHKNRFSIKNEFNKNMYKDEFERTNMSFIPEYKLSKNLTLKASHDRTLARKGYSTGVALEYVLKNSKLKSIKNLNFELNAYTIMDADNEASERFGFKTKYSF